MRIIEVHIGGLWIPFPFDKLEVGDRFRIFDDGVPFMDSFGQTEWTIKSIPKVSENEFHLYVEVEEETN